MWENKIQKGSISYKLLLSLLTSVLIVYISIIAYSYHVARHSFLKEALVSARNAVSLAEKEIDVDLYHATGLTESIALSMGNKFLTEDDIHRMLKEIVSQNEEICGSAVAFEPYSFNDNREFFAVYYTRNESGGVEYKDLSNSQYGYWQKDWYKIPKEEQVAQFSEPYFDEGGGNVIMSTYSIPFYRMQNGERRFWGIATVDVSLKDLSQIVSDIRIHRNGRASLISREGVFITFPDSSYILNQTIYDLAETLQVPRLIDLFQDALANKTGYEVVPIQFNGKRSESFLCYTRLDSTGWPIFLNFPKSELFAELRKMTLIIFAIALTGFVLLIGLIIYLSNRITYPLVELSKVTQRIGRGDFDVQLPEVEGKDEVCQLNLAIRSMLGELKNYTRNLEETTAAKEKIESELKIAHDIQMSIVPQLYPPFPHLKSLDLFGLLEPAKEVGGDLLDYFEIDDAHIAIAVGDVAGKGVPAALMMAIARTLLRAKTKSNKSASSIIEDINNELSRDNEKCMFVTFFLGIFNHKTRQLVYCNAGHNYPYLLRSNQTRLILNQIHGPALGVSENYSYQQSEIYLQEKDSLLIYTDGVPEAKNMKGEFFGQLHLEGTFLKLDLSLSSKQNLEMLLGEVKDFARETEQFDDITLLMLKV